MENEEKKRKKQMLVLVALITFCVWFLLLVSINNGHADMGLCQMPVADDLEVMNQYGSDVRFCDTYTCGVNQIAALRSEGWTPDAGKTFYMFNTAVVGYRLYKNVGGYNVWVSVVMDYNGVGIIKEGCSSENTLMNDLLGWLMYIFTAVAYAWAFVIGIHTVNS